MLFFISAVQAAALNLDEAKHVSIHKTGISVKEALEQVKEQSGIYLLYQESVIDKSVRLDLNLKNASFREAMDAICPAAGLSYEVSNDHVLITQAKQTPAAQQPKPQMTVTGSVVDENGNPLPGASVKVSGTTLGTVADIDGNFTLKVPATATTLEVSFVGMKNETVKIGKGKTSVKVILYENKTQMAEVIVTGYQTISKERATGAYSIIKSDELAQKPTSNIASALNGLVPGLAVQSSPVEGTTRFVIRGKGTLQSSQTDVDPLVVVDGFAISSYSSENDPFATINPNDVESITVLKDAAATSIYGARAANGVIVITTKKGKEDNKLEISADAYWSISNRMDLDNLFNMASAESQFRFVELMHSYNPINLGYRDPYSSAMYRKQYMSEPYRLLYERDNRTSITDA